jgi:drug/metabolite transporter (DMT)-like permease
VVLVTTTPVWVTIFSPLFLKEKQSRTFSVGLAVAVVGIIITSISGICRLSSGGVQCAQGGLWGRDTALAGNLLALAGAWCVAGYMMVGRRVRKDLSNRSYVFLVYSVSAVTLLLISLLTRQPLLSVSKMDLLWLVALALIPQVVGHSLLNWALGRLPAAYVSLSLLGEPVGSTVLAYLLLNESPSTLELIGAAVIIFGIYRATRPAKKTEPIDMAT